MYRGAFKFTSLQNCYFCAICNSNFADVEMMALLRKTQYLWNGERNAAKNSPSWHHPWRSKCGEYFEENSSKGSDKNVTCRLTVPQNSLAYSLHVPLCLGNTLKWATICCHTDDGAAWKYLIRVFGLSRYNVRIIKKNPSQKTFGAIKKTSWVSVLCPLYLPTKKKMMSHFHILTVFHSQTKNYILHRTKSK